MRTTITLADDVAAAVEQHRRRGAAGLSEAVNELIRKGLVAERRQERLEQATHDPRARDWPADLRNGPRRVGLPWQSLAASRRRGWQEPAWLNTEEDR